MFLNLGDSGYQWLSVFGNQTNPRGLQRCTHLWGDACGSLITKYVSTSNQVVDIFSSLSLARPMMRQEQITHYDSFISSRNQLCFSFCPFWLSWGGRRFFFLFHCNIACNYFSSCTEQVVSKSQALLMNMQTRKTFCNILG